MFRLLVPKKILSLLLLFNSSGTNPKPSIFFALWHFQHCHWLFAHCKHGDGFDNDCVSCDGIVCHSLEIMHFSSTWYYNCCDWHRKYGEYYKSITNVLGSSLIWMCWISNICFDFFLTTIACRKTTTIFLNSTRPNRWATKDICILKNDRIFF